MAGTYPIWLDAEMPADSFATIRRMLIVSLVLHLAGLALLTGIRFTPRVERLQATEVTLVSLPQPQPEAAPVQPAPQPVTRAEKAEPLPQPVTRAEKAEPLPQPVTRAEKAEPLPQPVTRAKKAEPLPLPPPKPVFSTPRASAPVASKQPVLPSLKESMTMKAADDRLRDALRGIERPPEAPRLSDYRPAPVPVPPVAEPSTQEKLPLFKESMTMKAADDRLRDALRGIERPPEAPRLSDYRPAPVPVPPVAEPRTQERPPSLSDLIKPLEDAQRPQPKPAVASKPKPAAKPATTIRVSGDDSGLSRYLAIVQSRISEQWVAPPVDVANRSYQVIVKFRLHRSGRISDVVIERESGNGYYDDAGKRAVLSVGSLPPFPPYVAEDVLETHFSFTVGEQVG